MVETTRSQLRAASFLDGRERFWSAEEVVDVDLSAHAPREEGRFIFHVGFCGSTLLARLLDQPGSVLSLKEPQSLADIASQRGAILSGGASGSVDPLIDHALECLARARGPGEVVVIKPTNWVNSLLPWLCTPERSMRAVFVSMDPRAFLGAVFRGGRARLEFCTRLCAEVAQVVPNGQRRLVAAIDKGGNPLDQSARIAALLHAMQEDLFDRAIAANGWSADVRVYFSELLARPDEVAQRVRSVLALAARKARPASTARLMARHTKDPAGPFIPDQRRREDAEIEELHGARFDAALDWLNSFSGAASR